MHIQHEMVLTDYISRETHIYRILDYNMHARVTSPTQDVHYNSDRTELFATLLAIAITSATKQVYFIRGSASKQTALGPDPDPPACPALAPGPVLARQHALTGTQTQMAIAAAASASAQGWLRPRSPEERVRSSLRFAPRGLSVRASAGPGCRRLKVGGGDVTSA